MEDAKWIAKYGIEHIFALRGPSDQMLGIIGLAERRSERPYFVEDVELIGDLAREAAVTLDQQLLRRGRRRLTRPRRDVEEFATECEACGVVLPPDGAVACPRCGIPLVRCGLPLVLNQKFRLIRRLGSGGMGVVYLAEDMRLGRQVALKTLSHLSVLAARRCELEARVMARVVHPNVATLFGIEQIGDRPILVLEYLAGGTLRERLCASQPTSTTIIDWGTLLCDGLSVLHRDGIVHGDVKPSNIGFDRAGVAKLMDFGLASAIWPDGVLDLPGDTLPTAPCRWRTPRYAEPDRGETTDVSPQSDLWSLTAVLYEALFGQDALTALTQDRSRLRGGTPLGVPPELAALFSRAFDLRSDIRPASAEELRLWLVQARPIH